MRISAVLSGSGLILLLAMACQWLPVDATPNAIGPETVAQSPTALPQTQPELWVEPQWEHLSTVAGDLPVPGEASQQTASLVLDVDGDGIDDFVIGARKLAPALVLYRREASGWARSVIEPDVMNIEAGGAFADIDGDGDLDIVMGGDYLSSEVWWWENPRPDGDPSGRWTRRIIKQGGGRQHHDQLFADLDGDGRLELAFWNQEADVLYVAEIPDDPRAAGEWPRSAIFEGTGEGMALADIDQDGLPDLLAGGRWFKYTGGSYVSTLIDAALVEGRVAAADLIPGGLPEVVMSAGDSVGPLRWYACAGDPADPGCWVAHDLLDVPIDHGHSLTIADFDQDGHLDIFAAEMRVNSDNPNAGMWIFKGDGTGRFTRLSMAEGVDNHESRVADLDGDGDLDILGKPYNWETPRLDIWLNPGSIQVPPTPLPVPSTLTLDAWQRHVIDPDRPWRSVFVLSADLNGDGLQDVLSGGWWYPNPGTAGGVWERRALGEPLYNVATVADFDGDGDLDVLGTDGQVYGSTFAWAENDGQGNFSVHPAIAQGGGDFLQGVAAGRFHSGAIEVALSWHEGGGIEHLTVPDDPAGQPWSLDTAEEVSQNEQLTAGDIDGDGDPDLLLGTIWLRNDGDAWTPLTLFETTGSPDRNRLAHINADGRPDAVVGYEAISGPGVLAWYEQGADPAALWTEHVISRTVIGPMSLDVADMDRDGDIDVVVGEHNLDDPASARLLVFENVDGRGGAWAGHVVFTGDEHHDGAQVVDIDGDGDLDILSIGWGHAGVLLYENRAIAGNSENPLPTPPATATHPPTLAPTAIPSPTPPPPTAEPGETPARVTDGLLALYRFDEGAGEVVREASGNPALDLTISDPAAVRWVEGGLAVDAPVTIGSAAPATGLIDAIRASGSLTVEVWIRPANLTQNGPARVLTISGDPNNRNLTLGQGLWGDQPSDVFDVRLRTTQTDANGQPSLTTPSGLLAGGLVHVVYTRSADGQATIYLDGVAQARTVIGGSLDGWDTGYRLLLANEASGDRPWLGEYDLVALYGRALDPAEVTWNYAAGPG